MFNPYSNQVLSTGQFPRNLKPAKVTPIHKTDENDPSPYYQ